MKRTLRLPFFVIFALVATAFAAPAGASAASWTLPTLDHSAEADFAGPVEFIFPGGSGTITCNADAEATLQPGNTGSVDALTLQGCSGRGEGLDECAFAEGESEASGLRTKGSSIDLEGVYADLFFEECMFSQLNIAFEHVDLVPDVSESISVLTVSGGNGTMNGYESELVVTGSLEVDQKETYGIGTDGNWILADPETLSEPATVELNGEFNTEISASGSGFHCDVHGEATLMSDGKGDLSLLNGACKGWGANLFGGCQGQVYFSIPSSIQAGDDGKISVPGFQYALVAGSGCEFNAEYEEWGEGDLSLQPDHSGQMSSWTLDDEFFGAESSWSTSPWRHVVLNLQISPAAKYGIGS